MGRPTKLTPELQKKICDLVKKGNYVTTACAICGITETTFYKWMEKGKDGVGEDGRVTTGASPYREFVGAVKKAEGEAEAERVARIREAGKGGAVTKIIRYTRKDGTEVEEKSFAPPAWPADMTHLERRDPSKWGRRDRHEFTGKDNEPITVRVLFDAKKPKKG